MFEVCAKVPTRSTKPDVILLPTPLANYMIPDGRKAWASRGHNASGNLHKMICMATHMVQLLTHNGHLGRVYPVRGCGGVALSLIQLEVSNASGSQVISATRLSRVEHHTLSVVGTCHEHLYRSRYEVNIRTNCLRKCSTLWSAGPARRHSLCRWTMP